MNKIIALTIYLVLLFTNNLQAEIIDLQKDEKKFGEWRVFCETDVMMNVSYCKIGLKFFDNASAITIEPSLQSFSQFLIVIPKIKIGSSLQIRTDQNDLIFSKSIKENNFGLIEITEEQKKSLFSEMKSGKFLFLRFNIRDSEKEVTVKINLNDFKNALSYQKMRSLNNNK